MCLDVLSMGRKPPRFRHALMAHVNDYPRRTWGDTHPFLGDLDPFVG